MTLNDIYIRDPYILPYNGTYYMYGKTLLQQKGFCVYQSTDLVHWSEPQTVFTPPADFWADRDFWAPEVHVFGGAFYLFASFKAEGKCRATQIFKAASPCGPFVPLTKEGITPKDWECLDGTLYVDKKGKPHIVFCHEWAQIGDGTVCEMELSDDLTTAVSEPHLLWKASDHAAVVDLRADSTTKVTDGPFLVRAENGELLCIWSSFGKNGYMELVARSDNGDIDGHWRIDDEPLSAQHGGHGMIFRAFDGKDRFVMHCPNDHPRERAVLFELVQQDGKLRLK